jgi:phosphoribosylformylglycinamidine cyclo-ligase
MTERRAYAAAGVNVEAGERAVDLMRAAVEATHGPNVIGRLGGFGAAVALPPGYREPVLVSSTDGVGTKTVIAAQLGRFETIGRDLVAMCVDDVVCSGATPLFFLDYVAVGRIEPLGVAELVGGIAAGCAEAGCALVGGETAEHPGVMDAAAFDLAGCCVGIVERERLLDGTLARAGDAILGLASSGLHANGYSLVRTLIEQWDLDLKRPYQEQLKRSLGSRETDHTINAEPRHALATLGEVLLEPTRLYSPFILALREALERAGHELRGAAHITGGGLPGNVPRMLPEGLGGRLDPWAWPVPSVIRLFAALGGLDPAESRATFNGGIGMAVVVPPDAVAMAVDHLAQRGLECWPIGQVVASDELGGLRYAEGLREAVS